MKYVLSGAVVLALGLFTVPVAGCNGDSRPEAQKEPAPGAATEAPIQKVTAGKPARESLRVVTVQPGRVEAFEETPLYSKLVAYVKEAPVDIGDTVVTDQVLVQLWAPELEDEVHQKEALLAQAEAEVSQAESAVRAAEAAVKTAASQVARAKAGIARTEGEYARWKAEHARHSELAASASISQKVVEESLSQLRATEAARDEAIAEVESAEAGVEQAEANVEKAQSDSVAARAHINVAEADLARASTMLAYTAVKAPFPGVVIGRNVDTGHYVQPGGGAATPLVVVARTDRVRIVVDVPETEAALADRGDPVIVRIQALRGEEIPGTIARTSWALDAMNRALRIEIDIPNKEGRLRPGMYASVEAQLAERHDAVTLPVAAVVREGRDTFCFCVESGRATRQPIQLGVRSGDRFEVLSGLKGDELVVLARAGSLKDGQPVDVIDPSPAK